MRTMRKAAMAAAVVVTAGAGAVGAQMDPWAYANPGDVQMIQFVVGSLQQACQGGSAEACNVLPAVGRVAEQQVWASFFCFYQNMPQACADYQMLAGDLNAVVQQMQMAASQSHMDQMQFYHDFGAANMQRFNDTAEIMEQRQQQALSNIWQ